jgi:hypothetical protein
LAEACSPGVCLANLEGSLTVASPALRLTGIFKDAKSIYQFSISPNAFEEVSQVSIVCFSSM